MSMSQNIDQAIRAAVNEIGDGWQIERLERRIDGQYQIVLRKENLTVETDGASPGIAVCAAVAQVKAVIGNIPND